MTFDPHERRETITMVFVPYVKKMQPVPDVRSQVQDWHALSQYEQESIERYYRSEVEMSAVPPRAQVYIRRHMRES